MNKFCPFCKADCNKQCGLYDEIGHQCSIVSLSTNADGIGSLLSSLAGEAVEISRELGHVAKVISLK